MHTIQVFVNPRQLGPVYFGILSSDAVKFDIMFTTHPDSDRINRLMDAGAQILHLHGASFVSVDHRPIPATYMIPAAAGHVNMIMIREGLTESDFTIDMD
jgi:hypothetical protein